MTETLLVATTNPGKLREIQELLAGLPYRLATTAEAGIQATIVESGTTFSENAVLKAEAYAGLGGALALADDSGLEIAALGGEPGIRTARFGGDRLTQEDRYRLVLDRLTAVPAGQRNARFVCVVAIAEPGRLLATFEGTCSGVIAEAPAGEGGFGYDPIFIPEGESRTMAQLPDSEKHRVSHRGRALAEARIWLADRAARSNDDARA